MKKILCIGDSLSLPGHGNKYEDTWIYKLKKSYPEYDFITFFRRGLTTDVLNKLGGGGDKSKYPYGADCLEHFMPNIIILQLGIVDCAPRLFKKSGIERKILSRLPKKIRNNYISFVKKIRERKTRFAYVSAKNFYKNIETYLNRAKENNIKKTIYIAIPIPSSEYLDRNKKAIKNIKLYNEILNKLSYKYKNFSVIKPLINNGSEDIYDDGYHPNPKGNKMVAEMLEKEIINVKVC